MEWVLTICMGVSSWGCGAFARVPYPTEEACYKALERMKTGDSNISESNRKRNTVAYCAPKGQ